MLLISRFFKFILLLIGASLLSQCATSTKTQTINDASNVQVQANQSLLSPYTLSAAAYLALAKNQTGSEKQSLLILAAGRSIDEGQWHEGRTILSQTNDLSADLISKKGLLLAKIDLIHNQSRAAMVKLAAVQSIDQLPLYYQVQFHEMLATAYQSVNQSMKSVSERIRLERLLSDEASKATNRGALWLTLTMLPIADLHTLADQTTDTPDLNGWIHLAIIARKHSDNAQWMLTDVAQWKEKFPQHPGNYVLPSPLSLVSGNLFDRPKKIALLLPLTGPLAGPGGAVKDGFMAGIRSSNASNAENVRVYNTDVVNVDTLYQQAVADGANYIVGPLSKVHVNTVASMIHPVPTLLLNDADTRPQEGAYQFGLSPSNEARQIAVKARSNGYTRALVIAPAGGWGEEVIAAFAAQWRSHGGRIVDTLHYGPHEDMNVSMRDFLHISASETRGKQLKQLLGQSIEFTPSRRQDFDVIFLLAYPSKARQIMPLLTYYYAGDMPVYATSAVYAGGINAMKDRDLNGIIFCDMPWVFAHQMGNKNWPEQFNSYNRLYALGMDSYALSAQLNQLLVFPSMGIGDKRGALHLTPSQQIERVLAWGQFKKGLAQPLIS